MTEPDRFAEAREALAAWRRRYPDDLVGADPHLRLVNALHVADDGRRARIDEDGAAFGRVVTGEIGPLVEHYRTRPPELVPYDGQGNPVDEVRFDHAYHEAGAHVWGSGLLAHAGRPGASFETATLFYLASHEGEMGHLCAVVCTTGLVRVLRRHASPALAGRYLPALTADDYGRALRGAQFLTEVQGGSDVGANASVAEPGPDGGATIRGEKWFCSVADAGLFLLLARPPDAPAGTPGLSCYVVPRTVDGGLNGFRLRRLKDKLGTTSMASGEIDFAGARAERVGDPGAGVGFKIMVSAMLNTSRWMNAVGDVGIMRRAYLEAAGYAATRRAFGARLADLPLVRLQVASMKAEWLGALHSTWALTALDEAVDLASAPGAPEADPATVARHRFLVNANKLACSLAATDVVRQGIEVLGGNGTIEDFSVLPRLLRDAIVYEQWEGTHNVLAAQVRRDAGRLGLLDVVGGHLAAVLDGLDGLDGSAETAARARRRLDELRAEADRALGDPVAGALLFRSTLEGLVRVHQVALLLDAAADPRAGSLGAELAAAARLLIDHHGRSRSATPAETLLATVDAVLGADLEAAPHPAGSGWAADGPG
ncbi:MAG: acyl-CoA dehydrogenase family protein [Acidimicrobiales bacterium]|nr:acyl-CoA dehydrogenase family protein [Acidimicrobiales bacterium]